MENVLRLPKTIEVNRKANRVDTDFRRWMDVQRVLLAPELTPWERTNVALYNVFGAVPPPEDYEAYMDGLMWFYRCGKEPRGRAAPERLLDWQADFDAIWADFRIYCRIDLRRTRYLHWWEFMALFISLPKDSEMKRRIAIRNMELGKIKDPQTRDEYRRLKEAVSLEPVCEDMDEFYRRVGGETHG